MKRPEGFDRPAEAGETADAGASEPTRSVADEVREVVRLDALRLRRDRAAQAAEHAATDPSHTAAEPRRWALSAYADLDDGADAAPPTGADGATEGASAELGREPGVEPGVLPGVGAASADPFAERGSNAQRVDRAWRKAQREQRRLDREELQDAKREAKLARRARARTERAEVRRFTAARRRQLRVALLTTGGLALALLLLVGLVWSPLMAVREVRVEGTDRLEAATVQEALSDQLGEPIATVTETGIAERLQAIPQIESFRVDVVPPSTVIVRLIERRPVAIIETDAGSSVIDAAGVVLGQVDESTQALPRLDGVELGTPEFEAVASVLVSVPADVLTATESIAAPSASDVQLTLSSGQQVQWGGAEESPLKADVVAALMATQDPAAASVLDVRAPEHPVVRGPEGDGS